MTTVSILADADVAFEARVDYVARYGEPTTQSSTAYVISADFAESNHWVEVDGLGFEWIDGKPQGGTVTRIVLGANTDSQIEITGFSLSLSVVFAALHGGQAPSVELARLFGDTTFNGGEGNDFWNAGPGRDHYFGNGGNDYFWGNDGSDAVSGGAGDDRLDGGNGNDTLSGGEGDDELDGQAGNDRLLGGNGHDDLVGASGNDTIFGGDGVDRLDGGTGADLMQGGVAGDFYVLDNLGDIADERGNDDSGDTIVVGYSFNLVTSTQLKGQFEDLRLTGDNDINGIGNDRSNWLTGNAGNNVLNGAAGNDRLNGESGNDILVGGTGDDWLFGGDGKDILRGGSGNDTYLIDAVGPVTDVVDESISGSGGTDTIETNGSFDLRNTAIVKGAIENLILDGWADLFGIGNNLVNTIRGNDGINRLSGQGGADKLFGGDGNDILDGGSGADHLSGGTGTDRAVYASSATAVTVSLANPALNAGGAKGDTFNSIEDLTGSAFGDTLFGSNGANLISGGDGNDIIKGYKGNDTLLGGSGRDVFIFNSTLDAATNVDTLADFRAGVDKIHLDNAFFKAFAQTGPLPTHMFRDITESPLPDLSDRILYNRDIGAIYYDPDGAGSAVRILFAKIDPGTDLGAADFVVI